MSKRRKYSGEFKREAVAMANQAGVTKAQIGQDLGKTSLSVQELVGNDGGDAGEPLQGAAPLR